MLRAAASRAGKTMLSRVNDWFVEHGHGEAAPDIVDRAHEYPQPWKRLLGGIIPT
ncbi:hypothetical protein [Candidatus Poriferisodalis sp.]|uniref:hypothetical protein n=1 Tax=Candidatus Poriferisodalis sp. TaxID=3101277 RepID=UPI003B01DD75